MNKLFLLLFICIPMVLFSQSKKKIQQTNTNTTTYNYQLELAGVGNQGNCTIKVWSIAPDPALAGGQAAKNGVHGVIFKGVPMNKYGQGVIPLIKDYSNAGAHDAFFEEFFKDGGDYMRFVSLVYNGTAAPGDMIKLGKKEYKIGLVVVVQYESLRKYLEAKNIIEKLGSGF